MATIKLQDGKVVLKDGKVSCECCDTCDIPFARSGPIITSEQYSALGRGGVISYNIQASLNACEEDFAEYSGSNSGTVEKGTCFLYGDSIPSTGGSGIFFQVTRTKFNENYHFFATTNSFGGYSGPNFGLVPSGSGNSNPYVSVTGLSVSIDGEQIPCSLFISQPSQTFPDPEGFPCSYNLNVNISFISNPPL